MAGFIFGSDEDTVETADAIASFASQVAIPTAMTGMLTPIPHTPLGERLRAEGRLREAEFSGNNTDDAVQFVPRRMTIAEMQRGYYEILERLFAPGAMFERSRALLERLEPHIFHGGAVKPTEVRAALRSLWRQGLLRAPRREYFRLLWMGMQRDAQHARDAQRALLDLDRRTQTASDLATLIDFAYEAMVRSERTRGLDDIAAWAQMTRAHLADNAITPEETATIYRWSREYYDRQRQLHRFPGAYLVKAFNLAIKGLHYETVMHGLAQDGLSSRAT